MKTPIKMADFFLGVVIFMTVLVAAVNFIITTL
jgi:hypothetical protein